MCEALSTKGYLQKTIYRFVVALSPACMETMTRSLDRDVEVALTFQPHWPDPGLRRVGTEEEMIQTCTPSCWRL